MQPSRQARGLPVPGCSEPLFPPSRGSPPPPPRVSVSRSLLPSSLSSQPPPAEHRARNAAAAVASPGGAPDPRCPGAGCRCSPAAAACRRACGPAGAAGSRPWARAAHIKARNVWLPRPWGSLELQPPRLSGAGGALRRGPFLRRPLNGAARPARLGGASCIPGQGCCRARGALDGRKGGLCGGSATKVPVLSLP